MGDFYVSCVSRRVWEIIKFIILRRNNVAIAKTKSEILLLTIAEQYLSSEKKRFILFRV